MPDDNYFDSEKAFHEATDPSRRSFLKKVGAIVAGAVALDRPRPKLPDPPPPVPPVPTMTSGYAQVGPLEYETVAYTCASNFMTTDPVWYTPEEIDRLKGRR